MKPRRIATAGNFGIPTSAPSWRASCLQVDRGSVFRAAVFSIVLSLGVGPNVTVLCAVWCHPDEALASACQHRGATASPRATGEDSCRTAAVAATALVREGAKRESEAGTQQGVLLPPFRVAPSPADTSRLHELGIALAGGRPPLLIALRI